MSSTALLPSSSEAITAPPAGSGPWLRWLPVLVWAAFISWFSTGAFSAHSTNHYIDPILRLLFGELTGAQFRFAHAVVRKSAHLTEYGILAILLCRAMTVPHARVTASVVVRAVLLCALYACVDEFHQTFVPDRTGSPIDVLVDTSGASIATALIAWWRGMRSPPDAERARAAR